MHDDTDEPTIATVAHDALAYFTTSTRADGSTYVHTIHVTPSWLDALIRDAHAEMLPDDWRYATIRAALGFIEDQAPADECEADEDLRGEFADSCVDVYNADRFAWLASNYARAEYCDEATDEFGPCKTIVETIGRGQFLEAEEIFTYVMTHLARRLAEVSA